MKLSQAGLSLLKQFEGCRLTAYKDAVGVWTIGYGHTAMAGPPSPRHGMQITQREADALLVIDVVKYEATVEKAISPRIPTQNQFDAMASLCYNIGQGGFAKSSVARHMQSGDIAKAANAFLLWNKAGGKVLKGLENRRAAERALFLLPASPTSVPEPSGDIVPPPPQIAPTASIAMPKPSVSMAAGGIMALIALLAAFFGLKG